MKNILLAMFFSFLFVIFLILFFTLPGSVFLAIFTVFPFFNDNLVGEGGMNVWLAKSLATAFMLLTVYGGNNLLRFNKERRMKGLIVLCVTFPAFFIIMYSLTKNYNFNPKNGEALVNISETPDGTRKVPKSWKYDPTYGNKTEVANPENIQKITSPSFPNSGEYLPPSKELDNLSRTLQKQWGLPCEEQKRNQTVFFIFL